MKKVLRKAFSGFLILAPLSLGGCQAFGIAGGILGWLIPAALSVGGAVGTYYLIKALD